MIENNINNETLGIVKNHVNWVSIEKHWEKPKDSDLTFIDLFSGAGGISCGFEMAGLNGILGLDNFDAAVETYSKNFKHPPFDGDITKDSAKTDFVELVKSKLNGRKLNIVVGGFPCQGFSMAGAYWSILVMMNSQNNI